MSDEGHRLIELDPHDLTRVWNLAIAIYDGEDDEADLRDSFVQAMHIYRELLEDFAAGGTTFDDGDQEFVSELVAGPNGQTLRFVARELPKKAKKEKDKDKEKKKKKA